MKDKDKPMTATPDMGQTHDTCGGIKHVLLDPNPQPHRAQNQNKRLTD